MSNGMDMSGFQARIIEAMDVLMNQRDPVRHMYVHVPFCPTKCAYCAFVTHVGSLKLREPYVEALRREAQVRACLRPTGLLETVYFGGGTPSMLEPWQVAGLLQWFSSLLGLTSDPEITLEAHPATVSRERLEGFRQAGVTRLSFGIETVHPRELADLGRRQPGHSAGEIVRMCRAAGFDNVNLDLMYGIPGQTRESWGASLERVISSRPDHLSLYPLSIEPRTVFARRFRSQDLELPRDDEVVAMYHLACDKLRQVGFEHYEVANWARPGKRSRHNLAYWLNREFHAIGVGAHGFVMPYRTENLRQTRRYIDTVLAGEDPVVHRELVDRRVALTETMMLQLRLLDVGLDLDALSQRAGVDLGNALRPHLSKLLRLGLLDRRDGRFFVPERAVPLANEVWEGFVM